MGKRQEPRPDQLLLLKGCDEVALHVVHTRLVGRTRSILPFQAAGLIAFLVFVTLYEDGGAWLHPENGKKIIFVVGAACAIVYGVLMPRFLCGRAELDVAEAMPDLEEVTTVANQPAASRIHITGAPAELCAVLAATHFESPIRSKELPLWGPVANHDPLSVATVAVFFGLILVLLLPCLGLTAVIVVAIGYLGVCVGTEHLRPTHLIVDNRRLKLLDTRLFGAEDERESVSLLASRIRIDLPSKALLIGQSPSSQLQIEMHKYWNPYKIAGAILANALPEETRFGLESIGEWGRVMEVRTR